MADVLIVLPPSESKAPPSDGGRPVDLGSLSFPALTSMRARVLDALITTSARSDALARLTLGASAADEVVRNTCLKEVPARPALELYAGVLYDAIDASTLSTAAQQRAKSQLAIVSALWGALRPMDRVPAYRLPVCADLVGIGSLEASWRPVLGPVLAEAAGRHGIVVDLRSSSFLAVGTARGLADRTVLVRVARDETGGRSVGGHVSKRTRGQITRYLLESGTDPQTPAGLAETLADHWDIAIIEPPKAARPWTIELVVPS